MVGNGLNGMGIFGHGVEMGEKCCALAGVGFKRVEVS